MTKRSGWHPDLNTVTDAIDKIQTDRAQLLAVARAANKHADKCFGTKDIVLALSMCFPDLRKEIQNEP